MGISDRHSLATALSAPVGRRRRAHARGRPGGGGSASRVLRLEQIARRRDSELRVAPRGAAGGVLPAGARARRSSRRVAGLRRRRRRTRAGARRACCATRSGRTREKVPRFAFGKAVANPGRFAETALQLEDLGVAAYNGQAANLSKPRCRRPPASSPSTPGTQPDPRDSGSPSGKPTYGLALDPAAGARTGRRYGLRARITELDLGALDRDGALRETAAGLPRETRRDFLVTLAGGARHSQRS